MTGNRLQHAISNTFFRKPGDSMVAKVMET
jgi:hypothetical protein